MLKKRVVPVLLLSSHGLVKGKNFDHSRKVGSPQALIRVFRARDVDELVLLDVEATLKDQEPRFNELEKLARECDFPLAVGGGISSKSSIEKMFRLGADKIVLNSTCYADPALVAIAAKEYGSQSVVVSIDYRSIGSSARCYSHSGTHEQPHKLRDWAMRMEDFGAGELIIGNCDRDGTLTGYDIEGLRSVVDSVTIPVIASGGAGTLEDFSKVIDETGVDAVSAGSVFLFSEVTPRMVRDHLESCGIAVRRTVR